jgi:UDP-N-acetylmuramoylalanine--D-glutamate ligase
MRISLFGYGLTTRAIARRLGGGQTFYDDRTTTPRTDEENNTILPSSHFDPDTSDLEILTPSIRPDNPLLQQARNPVSEYDLFLGDSKPFGATVSAESNTQDGALQTHPTPFTIWISGTNGKTTTTQMLTHLLAPRGALAGGNIGTPLADLDPNAPIWVLESSSYALHHTHVASPDVYLLLPITPDHLDWHGTAEAYTADKLRPLLTMREGELALVPKGLELPPTDAWVIEYDSVEFLAEFFDLDPSRLRYRAAFLEDAMLALAVTRTLFDEADYDRLNAFTLDHHRQEEITDARGRLWVNDSKATNVDATLQALATYADRPIHLILGGDDKGVDLSELMDTVATMDITLYAVGTNHDKLMRMAHDRAIPAHSCHTLAEAIPQIDTHLAQDEVALLSPAASSLDQFPSYAKRGELFVETVHNLRDD